MFYIIIFISVPDDVITLLFYKEVGKVEVWVYYSFETDSRVLRYSIM